MGMSAEENFDVPYGPSFLGTTYFCYFFTFASTYYGPLDKKKITTVCLVYFSTNLHDFID